MTEKIKSFGEPCALGEGIFWHHMRQQLFWFNIPTGTLYCANEKGEMQNKWQLGLPASAAAIIDENNLLIATKIDLRKFNLTTGKSEFVIDLEANNKITRSNDGRCSFAGGFWIGTMFDETANETNGKIKAKQGAYYIFKAGKLTKLFGDITIPNATCFSPNKKFAFLCDTPQQIIWRVALDENGNPFGKYKTHIDLRKQKLNPDGAVCDSHGYLWNAQYGAGQIARYAPNGKLDKIIKLPASQPTCIAFGGKDLSTLYITTARQHLTKNDLANEPDAGKIFYLQLDITGLAENKVLL